MLSAEQREARSGTRVCVTGADGFLASHIVSQLLMQGYNVHGTVRNIENMGKASHLLTLPGASERLRLFEADLMTPEQFDGAIRGCDYVLHTASPHDLAVNHPQKELVEPAVTGAVGVVQSVARVGGVRRIVFTSSSSAITDEPEPGHVYTEADWNEKSTTSRNPYALSKKLAEEEATKKAVELGLDFVSICPFVAIGPALAPEINPTNAVISQIMNGDFSAILGLEWPFVDVRDVARAHILAMESPGAKGRYLCANVSLTMRETVDILRHLFPQYKYPGVSMDNAAGDVVVKAASFFQPGQMGQYLRTNVGREYKFDNGRIRRELGLEFMNIETTLRDTVLDLIKWGEVEDRIPRELTAADAEEYRIRMTDPALGLKLAEHGLIHKHLNSFTGSECTDWLMLHGKLRHRSQAVRIGEALLTRGVIKPTGKVEFKDSSEIYTF